MRILIVGGGVAGLSLAALLRQRGLHPCVVEKARAYDDVGYYISLWPMGSRVLWGLSLHQTYLERGAPLERYRVVDGEHGTTLQEWNLEQAMRPWGSARVITRAALLDSLRCGLGDIPIRMGTTVGAILPAEREVVARFSDGSDDAYDLVVGCDGVHSRVRALAFGDVPLRDWGWRGWGWWLRAAAAPVEGGVEYWGRGRLLGAARVGESLGCFAALPIDRGPTSREPDAAGARALLRTRLRGMPGIVPALLDELDAAEDLAPFELADLRMSHWSRGRVLLIGDAGAPILPTAGVGASMALESAAVLADELSRVDARRVPYALKLFVERRRARVHAVQRRSRQLMRLARWRAAPLVALRRCLLRQRGQRALERELRRYMAEPI